MPAVNKRTLSLRKLAAERESKRRAMRLTDDAGASDTGSGMSLDSGHTSVNESENASSSSEDSEEVEISDQDEAECNEYVNCELVIAKKRKG